ncbi:MAG: AraC family transcriptional regulator [Lachnospiraceae bacterium]|nr:AraC family transcriptional regulator [Lachnospiraceae bacterium]
MKNSKYLLEKRRHGTVDFPCAIYQHNETMGPLHATHHWHTNMEIVHFNGGDCRLEVDMEPFIITKECFAFINPEELHCIDIEGESFRESAVVFDWGLLDFSMDDPGQRMLLRPLAMGEKTFPRMVDANDGIGQQIKVPYGIIMAIFRKDVETFTAADVLRVKSALLDIIAIMEENGLVGSREKVEDYRAEYLKKILNFIQKEYGQKIRIRDMADLVGMNEQYFCRFFKKMIGKTPVEYLNEYRVEKAKDALASSDESIMNIAMDCGFNHMGNFINMFKKKEGYTPSEYRKQIKMSK